MGPVLAPAGTVACRLVLLTTVNALAATPLKRTPVAPVNAEPVTITSVPTGP